MYLCQTVSQSSVLTKRNELSAFGDEELDVLFWNRRTNKGLYFLPCLFIAECKNSSNPVGSRDVTNFKSTLRSRGCDYGILVAVNGISGTSNPPTHAYHQIAVALADMIKILPITRGEIEALNHSDDLVELLKRKLCELSRRGTAV